MTFWLKIEPKPLPLLGRFVRRLLYHGIKGDRQQNCAHRRSRVFIWYIYKCVPQRIPDRLKSSWLRPRLVVVPKFFYKVVAQKTPGLVAQINKIGGSDIFQRYEKDRFRGFLGLWNGKPRLPFRIPGITSPCTGSWFLNAGGMNCNSEDHQQNEGSFLDKPFESTYPGNLSNQLSSFLDKLIGKE